MAQIPLIHPDEWGPEACEAFTILGAMTKEAGSASNLCMTLANHPPLAKAFYTLGRHVGADSTLPPTLRELAILRLAWLLQCEYEWCHHVRFGQQLGLTDAQIEAVREGPQAQLWSELEHHALTLTDELHASGRARPPTWSRLSQLLSPNQLMDLVFTLGHYLMTGWAINAFQIRIEPAFESPEHPLVPGSQVRAP